MILEQPLVPVAFDWQAGGSGDESFRGKSRSYIVRKDGNAGSVQANKVQAVAIPQPVPIDMRQATCKDHGFDAGEDGTSRSNYSNPKPGDPCHPLAAGAHPPAVAFANTAGATNLGISGNGEAPPITTRNGDPGNVLLPNMAVRRLTPRECERLQGFPDDYTDIPWRKKPHAPDGPRYKALGNSMACNVMRWIGQRIAMVEESAATEPEAA
jgi:site-specific DNA-cytosine methylase